MRHKIFYGCLGLIFSFAIFSLQAQITIDVNANVRHTIGGVDSFDRAKFITLHADQVENEWGGWNFVEGKDLRDTFLNHLDVYMGRNTGGISWQLSQVREDPNRPGYADTNHLASRAAQVRNNYAAQNDLHQYEARNNLIIAAQQKPFFPDGTLTGQGWAFANGSATGEYMAQYIKLFHGANGQPKPAFVEVMNEPLWEFVTTTGAYTPAQVFQFHNEVADEIRKVHPDMLIGGYAAAFPDLEVDDFQRWNDRWKSFMDISGDKMDYWALHLYDFALRGGIATFRKGSNMEATFDMIEQYSQLKFDETKPFLISEYGAVSHDLNNQPWSPYKDWMVLKSLSAHMLSFMDRPDNILMTIPFIPVKAEWGRTSPTIPYNHRLMRQAKEGDGETGDHWVYTEMVKFYQLWQQVNGVRVDARATNLDIQTDAYVDGNKLFLILNNLLFDTATVSLNIVESSANPIQQVRVKHLYLSGNAPVLDDQVISGFTQAVLEPEATMVIEYTFQDPVLVNQEMEETKYYATEYLKQIIAGSVHEFQMDSVELGVGGEATLRIGLGRNHGKSLQPKVWINDRPVDVPDNYMGYDQLTRVSWFGVIEIPVPYALLQEENTIKIQFSDGGGHISSVAMRVFNTQANLVRSDSVAVRGVEVLPASKQLTPGSTYGLIAQLIPLNSTDHQLSWSSTDPTVATVDAWGRVDAMGLGTCQIIALHPLTGAADTSQIEVLSAVPPVAVMGFYMEPDSFVLPTNNFLQITPFVSPIDAGNQTVIWISSDPTVATVDANGLVLGLTTGTLEVVGTTQDGGLMDTTFIEVRSEYPNSVDCSTLPITVNSHTTYSLQVDYTAAEQFDLAIELKDAQNNWVGEGRTTISPGKGTAAILLKCVSTVNWTAPVYPTPGDGYKWLAWIRDVGGDWRTNKGGCSQNNVKVNPITQVDPTNSPDWQVYPNPANHTIQIELPQQVAFPRVEMFNLLGELVLSRNLTVGMNDVSVADFPDGTYLIEIISSEARLTRRVMVQH